MFIMKKTEVKYTLQSSNLIKPVTLIKKPRF